MNKVWNKFRLCKECLHKNKRMNSMLLSICKQRLGKPNRKYLIDNLEKVENSTE